MPDGRPLKILVIGCGSIGRRHIRLVKEMGVEVAGVEPDIDALAHPEILQVLKYRELETALNHQRWDGAIIATPNHLHREPAMECIWNGLSVLVEKPLAHNMYDAMRIVNAPYFYGEEERSKLLVGYCLRFHPGLRRVKELLDAGAIGKVRHASIHFGSYLPDWRPGFDYRQGYAARRETGGGILLDASHELDYACWLFGKPVSVMAQVQNTGALEIETEDIADVLLRFESGAQVSIHLDYLSREYRRTCTIVGDAGNLDWDFASRWTHERLDQEKYPGGWAIKEFQPDDMYRAELQHFLAVIRGEEQPLVTGEDGIRALRLVEAARQSSEEGRVIQL